MPAALPDVAASQIRRDQLRRRLAAAVTVFTATIAVLAAAMTAVMLGLT